MGPRIPAYLLVDRASRSLGHRALLGPFGNATFLDWWIDRFKTRYPEQELVLLFSKFDCGGDFPPSRHDLSVFPSNRVNKIAMLLEAACTMRVGTCMVCDLGFAFAPRNILRIELDHHFRTGNQYTLVAGFPSGTCPEIYEVALLDRLSKMMLPGLPTNPALALARLADVERRFHVHVPISPRHAALKAEEFYKFELNELPERLKIDCPMDLEIAKEVVRAEVDPGDPVAELKSWRRASIRRRKEALYDLHRSISSHSNVGQANKRPRILFVSVQSAYSGAEASLCELVGRIDRERFALFAAVGARGLLSDRLQKAGVTIITSESAFGRTPGEQCRDLLEILSSVKPNLVHLNGLGYPHFAGVVAGLGIPLITHFRISDPGPYGDELRMATRVIAVSDHVKRCALRLELDPEDIEVVYDEVDTEMFSPRLFDKLQVRASLDLPQGAFILVMVARFSPNKRHRLLLEAAQEAKRRLPKLFLVLLGESLGDSSTLEEVTGILQNRRLHEWIRIIPFLEDVRPLLAAADGVILSSRNEALGRCAVEAMSMGKPVIVSDSGGTREIVSHGQTGFVVEGEDPHIWARQIIEVGGGGESVERIGQNARAFAEQNLDSRISARKVMSIYDSIMRGESQ